MEIETGKIGFYERLPISIVNLYRFIFWRTNSYSSVPLIIFPFCHRSLHSLTLSPAGSGFPMRRGLVHFRYLIPHWWRFSLAIFIFIWFPISILQFRKWPIAFFRKFTELPLESFCTNMIQLLFNSILFSSFDVLLGFFEC